MLQAVLEKYMVRPAARAPAPRASPASISAPTLSLPLDDQELIRKAQQAKGGGTFAELWAGGLAGYKSHSEADIALCNSLAWWTNGDAERVDRLFRQSGLYRDKWDRPQSGSTYGAITVQSAIATCQGGYDPRSRARERAKALPPGAGGRTLADLHPEHSARYGWHDIGNGNLFADWYRDTARYVPERKKWYFYTGKVWEPDTGNLKVMEMCKQQADALNGYALSLEDERQRNAYLGHVKKWQVRRNRETILKDAASVYPVRMAEFDRDRYLFNCRNGTLDLRTFEFRPHSPADMLATISGVIFDPEAKAELWERVIWDAMQGDADKVAFLQKSMGYGLTGDTSEECFFLLYGATTRNAKGTVMETYMKMLGGYGRTAKPETIAQRQTPNSNGPSEDIARLAGARVVNISEPGKQMVLSASLVKTLTGNDTVTARFLNENSFEYKPQFKLFVNTNHLPKVTDVTVFSSGRVKVIPFERHFTEAEQDKTLKRRLAKAEKLSGVLNWCLDGLRLMRETGFDPPSAVLEATSQYQRDSDKIARFVDETMEPDAQGEIRTEDAYKAYQEWCDRNGQKAEGMPTFKQSMSALAEVKRKRPAGAGRNANPQRYFCGLKWRGVPECATNL